MADEHQDADVEIQDFILSRELAEVYLLMDHISACQCKEIPASLNDDPVFKNSEGRTWLEQICEIAWPPEGTTRRQDARNAARLIRAKDMLNKAAAPATGGTIAFTLMMAGEARDPQSGSWWRRMLMWMADAIPKDLAGPFGEPPAPGGTGTGTGSGWGGGKPPSRASLASLAYPSLARRAWQYRVGLYFILGFLVMWLLVTCMLSWDVATGNSLLNRVTALDARVTTLESALAAPTTTQQVSVQDPTKLATSPTPPPRPNELENARALKARAMSNLATWMEEGGRIRDFLVSRMGGSSEAALVDIASPPAAADAPPGRPAPPRQETNSEWAAVLLGILASNILPIFYGLLGAGAAVVRSVSHKMRDSLLAPRDIWLAYVQLALGAVIGACIGLFVNSEGEAAATQSGLLGSVPLSASALCFIAGFGVEGVFQGLESLIRRVFNLETRGPAA
jgi:hypothetical protein